MGFLSLTTRAVVLVLFAASSSGLRVTPGSSCTAYCSDSPNGANNTTTSPSDIVCNDADYWSTTTGTKFRNCLTCLQNSTAVNGTETDVEWYLYNIRYAVDVCLFSTPGNSSSNSSTSSPCTLSGTCLPLQSALETGVSDPSNTTEYQYCTADNKAFSGTSLSNCAECLLTNSQQVYLSNFMTALEAGCKQQPPRGDVLGLNGTLFSTTAMTIVTPAWNQTSPGEAAPVTSLTTGTIVGIVVAGVLLIFGAILLFILYWRKQKRAEVNNYMDFGPDDGHFRQVKSISSSYSGGTVPFYTTDYKSPPANQRNFELYDKIKTQHVVIPERRPMEMSAVPHTAALWGRDTPLPTRQQMISPRSLVSPMSQHTVVVGLNEPLDSMPTHPAFIPRAFTRGSRNTAAMPEKKNVAKANKPDAYALQRYLEMVEDMSKVDIESLMAPPPAAAEKKAPETEKPRATETPEPTNPFITPQGTPMNIPPPPPGPPPAKGPAKANTGSKLTPELVAPSLTRIRKPKMYIPPPLNIAASRPKAQKVDSDSDESKEGR